MKTLFTIREYTNKEGLTPIYLHATSGTARERIFLDIYVDPKLWIKKQQRVKEVDSLHRDKNLILENIQGKITQIKTVYRLSEKVLTPATLKKELSDGMCRVNFLSYFNHKLEEEKPFMKKGTYKRYHSVYTKLYNYKSEIIFTDINEPFFNAYRKHLIGLANKTTTINSNIIAIKKYLRMAQKDGIKLVINIDDIKGGSTNGKRVSLSLKELQRVAKYYASEFIAPTHKECLGYFLFSCMTGLRISDLKNIRRSELLNPYLEFVSVKTGKDQIISLNKKAIEIVNTNPVLFDKPICEQVINRELKKIMSFLQIKKSVSFHVSRHTFATTFLRMGGKIEKLQVLLGHSKIESTMVYVHILAAEANKEIFLLDDLF